MNAISVIESRFCSHVTERELVARVVEQLQERHPLPRELRLQRARAHVHARRHLRAAEYAGVQAVHEVRAHAIGDVVAVEPLDVGHRDLVVVLRQLAVGAEQGLAHRRQIEMETQVGLPEPDRTAEKRPEGLLAAGGHGTAQIELTRMEVGARGGPHQANDETGPHVLGLEADPGVVRIGLEPECIAFDEDPQVGALRDQPVVAHEAVAEILEGLAGEQRIAQRVQHARHDALRHAQAEVFVAGERDRTGVDGVDGRVADAHQRVVVADARHVDLAQHLAGVHAARLQRPGYRFDVGRYGRRFVQALFFHENED